MSYLAKISTWKNIGIIALVYFAYLFLVMSNFGNTEAVNLGPLDLLFSYTPEMAFKHLNSFGEDGRNTYAQMSLIADTIYPIIYTTLFILLISRLVIIIWPNKTNLQKLALIPMFAFTFDLLENGFIRAMIKQFPSINDQTANLSSLFTSLKWSSVGVVFFAVSCLLVIVILQKLGNHKNRKSP